MREIIVKIKDCLECKYIERHIIDFDLCTYGIDREIKTQYIPSWCPIWKEQNKGVY